MGINDFIVWAICIAIPVFLIWWGHRKIQTRKAWVLLGYIILAFLAAIIFWPDSDDDENKRALTAPEKTMAAENIDSYISRLNVCAGGSFALIKELTNEEAHNLVQIYREADRRAENCENARADGVAGLLSDEIADVYMDEGATAANLADECNLGLNYAADFNRGVAAIVDGDSTVSLQADITEKSDGMERAFYRCEAQRKKMFAQLKLPQEAHTPVITPTME